MVKAKKDKSDGKINNKRSKKRSKIREKIDMYDMIIASMIEKEAIIEPKQELKGNEINIGFSSIISSKSVSKYFLVCKFSDYVEERLYDKIKRQCSNKGVRIDFYTYSEPHKIDWSSPEMVNRVRVWREFAEKQDSKNVFDYRESKTDADNKQRIIMSTKYLNESELKYKRTLCRTFFIIKVTADRNREDMVNMMDTIRSMKELLNASYGIKVKELRVNMLGWLRAISPFYLENNKEVMSKIPKKIMTDDNLANFDSIKQGKVGDNGIPIAIDVESGMAILHKFKENTSDADNALIAAETGSGKTYLMLPMINYLLADGLKGTIMDYEGDEYTNYVNYIRAANKEDVCIISVGKNSENYFDPCRIPERTGVYDIDVEAKRMSIAYIMLMFQKMVSCSEELSNSQSKIISLAIQRMHDSAGITEDMNTWSERSKELSLEMVYSEIKDMVNKKEFYDPDGGNKLHKAGEDIIEAVSIFFEEGEAYSGTFKKPIGLNEIYRAKLVLFSFGMKGQMTGLVDKRVIALKQLSVSYVNTLISNHCKYVMNICNFKVWEESQRWFEVAGSSEIIINEITGGRKRGDINFIVTNNLGELLDTKNRLGDTLTQNIQHYFIGSIPKRSTREKFCEEFNLWDILGDLNKIAEQGKKREKTNNKKVGSKYRHAFCFVFADGSKPVGRVELPKAISGSHIFDKGKVV